MLVTWIEVGEEQHQTILRNCHAFMHGSRDVLVVGEIGAMAVFARDTDAFVDDFHIDVVLNSGLHTMHKLTIYEEEEGLLPQSCPRQQRSPSCSLYPSDLHRWHEIPLGTVVIPENQENARPFPSRDGREDQLA